MAAALIGLPSVVAAAQPTGPTDVTNSAKGVELRTAAADRFASKGFADTPLRVLSLGDGGYVVAPSSLPGLKGAVAKLKDGKTAFSAELVVGGSIDADEEEAVLLASTRLPSRDEIQALAAPSWAIKESGCFAVIYDNAGHFDTCYKIRKLLNDGISNKAYYNLEHFGTASSYPWQTIDWAEIWSDQASGSATMTWSDWGPRTDYSEGQGTCTEYGLNIGVVVSLFLGIRQCEKWDMTKYTDAGHYKMHWSCNCFLGIDGDRGIEYMTEITVPSGGPLWVLGATFDG